MNESELSKLSKEVWGLKTALICIIGLVGSWGHAKAEPLLEGRVRISLIGQGISVTSENQIIVELMDEDLESANLFDLAGRTLIFTPDEQGGYSRSVGALAGEEDIGERTARTSSDRHEIEMDFSFEFSGQEWRSFYVTNQGLITFGEPLPDWGTPKRFGTMQMIADAFLVAPTISALYKPFLAGRTYVSSKPDRVVVTWLAFDRGFSVYGRWGPKEDLRYQVALHSDGRVAFHYGPQPTDPDEAILDGIVGLFPAVKTGLLGRSANLSATSSRSLSSPYEVFRYPAIRDRKEGVADVSCRIIEVLGNHYDFFAFNSESRFDIQETGPGHGFAGYYRGNIEAEVTGIGIEGDYKPPCESLLKNSWGWPVWMKAATMLNEPYVEDGHGSPYDSGLTVFGHEIGHTWLANAHIIKNGEQKWLTRDRSTSHWAAELHAPAPFPWRGTQVGSVMGGAYWRENADGTFTATNGWTTKGGGFSWLDLYLMGLASTDEVPDMFILRNLRREGPCPADKEAWECERFGPFAADKETVTIEQIASALGPRNPPAEQARKAFNTGFVYFLLPGETPDPELLRKHAEYRDRVVDYWHHVTGGRGQLTTELPDIEIDDGEEDDGEEDDEMAFGFDEEIADQAYTAGTTISALVLPEAVGGEGTITYRVSELPAGLSFDDSTRTISGTPEAATDGAVEITYTAEDSTGAAATLTFSIIGQATTDSDGDGEMNDGEEEDDEMAFGFAEEVADQAYTAGTTISALVLPEATGGEGEITYRVSGLPAGLSFDDSTRTISGTPEAATDGAVEITYTAEDSTGAVATLTFSITVNPALSFGDLFDLFN